MVRGLGARGLAGIIISIVYCILHAIELIRDNFKLFPQKPLRFMMFAFVFASRGALLSLAAPNGRFSAYTGRVWGLPTLVLGWGPASCLRTFAPVNVDTMSGSAALIAGA